MERIIKFRFWDKIAKEWVSIGDWQYHSVFESDRLVKSQYTDYDDVNGTPVFDGDIVWNWFDHHEKGCLGRVMSVPGGFTIHVSPITGYPMIGLCRKMEVLGNIYENPELVERVAQNQAVRL